MSNIPYLLIDTRWGYWLRDNVLVVSQYKNVIFCPLADCLIGETAENLVDKFNFTRKQLDEYALRSQNLAERAIKNGQFKDEIILIKGEKKKGEFIFDTNEYPRFDMTMKKQPSYLLCIKKMEM